MNIDYHLDGTRAWVNMAINSYKSRPFPSASYLLSKLATDFSIFYTVFPSESFIDYSSSSALVEPPLRLTFILTCFLSSSKVTWPSLLVSNKLKALLA